MGLVSQSLISGIVVGAVAASALVAVDGSVGAIVGDKHDIGSIDAVAADLVVTLSAVADRVFAASGGPPNRQIERSLLACLRCRSVWTGPCPVIIHTTAWISVFDLSSPFGFLFLILHVLFNVWGRRTLRNCLTDRFGHGFWYLIFIQVRREFEVCPITILLADRLSCKSVEIHCLSKSGGSSLPSSGLKNHHFLRIRNKSVMLYSWLCHVGAGAFEVGQGTFVELRNNGDEGFVPVGTVRQS